VGSCSG